MIREAVAADAAALARLQSSLPEPTPGLLDGALADATLTPTAALVSTDVDDDPVGYLLAVPGDGTTHVAELVVAPDYRREGRARALLAACAARTDDSAALTVTVASDNEAAQSLYRACGFERVERLPDFFDGGAGILYRRD